MYKILAKTLFIGKNVNFLPSCHSTNDEASKLVVNNKVIEGTLVITDNQTAGKGQRGNSWEAEPGKNLTFTLILRPTFIAVHEQFDLNIAVSLGIFDFLRRYRVGFQVKWPNDIYFYDKKICGILIQNSVKNGALDHTIVGIGLNINQAKFEQPRAVSLSQIVGEEFSLQEALEELMGCVEARYIQLRNGERERLKNAYLQTLYWYGEDHIFKADEEVFTGKIVGVNKTGQLEIETAKGERYFGFKEVQFVQ